jgi:hypothetical protein
MLFSLVVIPAIRSFFKLREILALKLRPFCGIVRKSLPQVVARTSLLLPAVHMLASYSAGCCLAGSYVPAEDLRVPFFRVLACEAIYCVRGVTAHSLYRPGPCHAARSQSVKRVPHAKRSVHNQDKLPSAMGFGFGVHLEKLTAKAL